MQDVLPLESETGENPKTPLQNLVVWGLSFLCWASPFIGLSIFFPLGVLFLYPKNRKLRIAAFLSLSLQLFITAILYPMDLYGMYSFETEFDLIALKQTYQGVFILFWAFLGLIFLFLEARLVIRRRGKLALFQDKSHINRPTTYLGKMQRDETLSDKWEEYRYHTLPQTPSLPQKPDLVISPESFFKTLFIVLFVWFIAIVWFCCLSYFFAMLNTPDNTFDQSVSMADQMFKGESALYLWFMVLISSTGLFGKKGIPAILRKPYISLYIHTKLSLSPTFDFFGDSFAKKKRFARIREMILPGWGHIYLQRYWKGFPILFTFLLVLFFLSVSVAFYMDISFGIKFLSSFGLKPGIPDKEFIPQTDNILYPVSLFSILLFIYFFANSMIINSVRKDGEPIEARGLQSGFTNNFYLSVIAHLILFAVILIIPISVQRNSSKKKQDMSKKHYQPEKMEYYFIDPDIPDEVKDLNGGVLSGTETPSQKDGIKIPDNPVEDEGKVKGYVKRVKGKKLPRTYSNYISARMRGPENFMEYWKRAPHPYSCVVAYTITTEGEIIDVILVEGSAYPDQDTLTLELIKSMSPVMPPPNVKGDVRVTELFWNGSIDPDAMPTPLQKDMVLHFDGRFMEEEF